MLNEVNQSVGQSFSLLSEYLLALKHYAPWSYSVSQSVSQSLEWLLVSQEGFRSMELVERFHVLLRLAKMELCPSCRNPFRYVGKVKGKG